ncbi:hypothetical protein [Thermocatellispora tengchongensis]|uniref:hypothetical protein n=1 Tax=Thermocatellispora tengchongensis TaxID=1073253 RepID=UPI003625F303
MERGNRRRGGVAVVAALAVAGSVAGVAPVGVLAAGGGTAGSADATYRNYMVFYADGARSQAVSDVERAGGTNVSPGDPRLGYVVARGPGDRFLEALASSDAVVGVSSNRKIGTAVATRVAPEVDKDLAARALWTGPPPRAPSRCPGGSGT